MNNLSCWLNYAAAFVTRSFFCFYCHKRVFRWKDWSPTCPNVLCRRCDCQPALRLVETFVASRERLRLRTCGILPRRDPSAAKIVEVAPEYITTDLAA
jgi:hypothetical protein